MLPLHSSRCFKCMGYVGALPCISSYWNPMNAVLLLGQQVGCRCLACHVDMEDKYSVWYVALALCNYVIQSHVYLMYHTNF